MEAARARGEGGQDTRPDHRPIEGRMERRLRSLFRPAGRSPVRAICADLDLIVELQRCARTEPERLATLVVRHGRMLDLWLFGVALACASLGLVEEAELLLDAVPGVQASAEGRGELLQELVRFGLEGELARGGGRVA